MDSERYDQILAEQEESLAGILSQGGSYEDYEALCEDRGQEPLIDPPRFNQGDRVVGAGLVFDILAIDRLDGRWIYQQSDDDCWWYEDDLTEDRGQTLRENEILRIEDEVQFFKKVYSRLKNLA